MRLHGDEDGFGRGDAAGAGEAVGEGDLGGGEVGGGERGGVEGYFVGVLGVLVWVFGEGMGSVHLDLRGLLMPGGFRRV